MKKKRSEYRPMRITIGYRKRVPLAALKFDRDLTAKDKGYVDKVYEYSNILTGGRVWTMPIRVKSKRSFRVVDDDQRCLAYEIVRRKDVDIIVPTRGAAIFMEEATRIMNLNRHRGR